MLNLLVSYRNDSWETSPYEFDKSRVAIEYTANEISERYKNFDKSSLNELMSFPTLFVTENETSNSLIGLIRDIKIRDKSIVIEFEIDKKLPTFPSGTIERLRVDLDLGVWELSRTHWAIKDEDLLKIFSNRGLITTEQAQKSFVFEQYFTPVVKQTNNQTDTSKVFIVHGHDELTKLDMANFITSLGLEPIILHMQASAGMTIIEKIEAYSNVGFAVVLYTPCDIGTKKGEHVFNLRARQNVVFEHGYLIAKLGRSKVTALVKGVMEIPNDISGVIYLDLDDKGNWKSELVKELKKAGYKI